MITKEELRQRIEKLQEYMIGRFDFNFNNALAIMREWLLNLEEQEKIIDEEIKYWLNEDRTIYSGNLIAIRIKELKSKLGMGIK